MKRFIIGALSAAALTVPAMVPAAANAKSCSPGYTYGVIGGAAKCLHGGEYCSRSLASQYPRYGYHCEDVRGTYRLES